MAAEKNFENRIKDWMEERGSWFIKYWGGAAYTKKGIPDLLCCLDGYFFGLEVIADNGKPTLLQLRNLERIRAAGGYGILLYPKGFTQFKELVEHKSKTNAWYIRNIDEQKAWKIILEKGV